MKSITKHVSCTILTVMKHLQLFSVEFWAGSNFSKYTNKYESKLEGPPVFIRAWRTQTYTADLYSRCFIFSSCKQASPIDAVLCDPWVWFWGFFLQRLSNLSLASEPDHKRVHKTLPCMLIFTQLVLKAQKNSIILPPSSPTAFPPTAMRTSYSSNTTERPINHLISQLWF